MQKNALKLNNIGIIERNTLTPNFSRAELISEGNWCGHDPASPRFFEKPEHHKERPKIITWAMDAWRRFYGLPSSYFKDIRNVRNSIRQQRSEAREALASISQVLLYYTELASLRVGIPHPSKGFRSLGIIFLAKKARIGLKRAQRAIKLLVGAGYLKMIERFDLKHKEGKECFIGLAAVKCLTPAFFSACNINLQTLSAQRALARKRLNKKRHTFISDVQKSQSQAVAQSILNFIVPKGNAKIHIGAMKHLLRSEQQTEERAREKERRRRESLLRRHQLK